MIPVEPIGIVTNTRRDLSDNSWGAVLSEITLTEDFSPDALAGITSFSHAEILFHFDRVTLQQVERRARHPRGNPAWPLVDIFAQRGKDRPNRLGSTIVEVVACSGRTLSVRGLDAIDGTPVLDIKPVMREFLPRGAVIQPTWASELMRHYWFESSE